MVAIFIEGGTNISINNCLTSNCDIPVLVNKSRKVKVIGLTTINAKKSVILNDCYDSNIMNLYAINQTTGILESNFNLKHLTLIIRQHLFHQ